MIGQHPVLRDILQRSTNREPRFQRDESVDAGGELAFTKIGQVGAGRIRPDAVIGHQWQTASVRIGAELILVARRVPFAAPLLVKEAERRFGELRLLNIVCRIGDGFKGWPAQAPYDRVIVTAAALEVPAPLVDGLAPGGILLAPVGGDRRDQALIRICRKDDGFSTEDLGPVRFVPLVMGLPRHRNGPA